MQTTLPLITKQRKSSRFRLWMIALLFTAMLAPISVTWGQRLGLHVTQQELDVWRARANNGPYKTIGDASANSPGDWDRIIKNANKFLTNRSGGRYRCQTTAADSANNIYPSTATGCVPKTEGNGTCKCDVLDPKSNHVELRDAAFASLVLEGSSPKAQQYRDSVWAELLAQAKEPRLNFNNRQRWCISPNDLGSANPGFMIAEWLTRLLFAYDYVKPYLDVPQYEKDSLDRWFESAAVYFSASTNAEFNKYFQDRPNGNYTPTTLLTNRESSAIPVGSWSESDSIKIGGVARWNYSNRWGSICTFVALWGIVANDTTFQKVGKDFYKEWLRFSVYPDNVPAEMERRSAAKPSEGLDYSTGTAAQAANLANHFARMDNPDYELYNFKTQEGFGGSPYASTSTKVDTTISGNANKWKSILGVYQKLITFYNGSFIRHYNGKVIDGSKIESNVMRYTVRDIWFAQANMYWNNAGIKNQYTRVAPGLQPYPSQSPINYVASSGVNTPFMGLGGMYPGVLFMFGQMENSSANPYRLKIASPTNNSSSIEGDAITITVDTSKVYGISGVEYYKDTDTTPFLISNTKPYAVAWNGALPGVHKIKARPISASTPSNPLPYSDEITITVNTCTASGTILREHWSNVAGNAIANIPSSTPDSTSHVNSFESSPINSGDKYAARYSGYLCAPESGLYTFWIISDNEGELWLSTDKDPSHKTLKARIYDGSAFAGQWEKYPTQKSDTIRLIAGKSYYIEALHKEGYGGDILRIGWRRPSSAANSDPVVIPGSVLSPFILSTNSGARISPAYSGESESTNPRMKVYPNPSTGKVSVHFSTTANEYASVNMYNLRGELVHPLFNGMAEKDAQNQVEVDGRQFASGLYIIRLVTQKKVDFQKVILLK